MFQLGDVISYLEMCQYECVNLQRGMNFRLRNNISVILMSLRHNAPYADRIQENGRVLIYEGHDISVKPETPNPKTVDQPMYNPSGTLTQNGLFYEAAHKFKEDNSKFEIVRVYEKIHSGIWTYNGLFKLVDAWQELSNSRHVFKFKLVMIGDNISTSAEVDTEHSRVIPASVKLEVWRCDKGAVLNAEIRKTFISTILFPILKVVLHYSQKISSYCVLNIIWRRETI